MSFRLSGNAVRLYVLVDTFVHQSQTPLAVIINKDKTIGELRMEFQEKLNYVAEEQHWLINHMYCFDDLKIREVVQQMNLFQRGYMAILFIMTTAERDKIEIYFGSFVEQRYSKLCIEDRWRNPVKVITVPELVNQEELKKIGWHCDSCTFFNKPFVKFCDVCASCRPENYVFPEKYYFTKEDKDRILKEEKLERKTIENEEKFNRRSERKKKEDLRKLKQLYKTDLVFTTDITECPICADEIQPGEAIVLRNCLHTICKNCLKDYITAIDNPIVKCFVPDCIGHVTHQEMQAILNKEEFERYQQLSLRTAEGQTNNTFHCKTPNCIAWIVFDDGVNFYKCQLCKKKNCILCGVIHEGQTCKEYQDELVIKARNDDVAKKDLAFLENLIKTGQAMKCPGCRIIIQKKRGCDWMQCNMCKIEICWATKGPRWGPMGRGDTSGGCRCRLNNAGPPCHPRCQYCH